MCYVIIIYETKEKLLLPVEITEDRDRENAVMSRNKLFPKMEF